MATGRLEIIRLLPGAENLIPILASFATKPGACLTSLSDARLSTAQGLLPEDSAIDVRPWGMLVTYCLQMCGGEFHTLAQSGHVRAAIASACREAEEDSPFFETRNLPGLHKALAQTIDELNKWGVNTLELDRIAEMAQGRLYEKVMSLALIKGEVDRCLFDLNQRSSADQIDECVNLSPPRGLKIGPVLVLAGSEYSPVDVRFLKWLSLHSSLVTVVVDSAPRGVDLFSGATKLIAELDAVDNSSGETNCLTGRLFQSEKPSVSASLFESPEVEIMSAPDPLSESEWVVRSVLQDVSEGVPLSRIAIFARSIDSYAPLLETVGRRFGVPIQSSRRAPLNTNSFVRLVLSTLHFCSSSDVRTLNPICDSSYLSVPFQLRTALHSKLDELFNEGDDQWVLLAKWSAEQSDELGWLGSLLNWRAEIDGKKLTLADWSEKLRSMSWMADLVKPEQRFAQRDERARSALQRHLTQIATVELLRGTSQCDIKGFSDLLVQLCSNEDTSIPTEDLGVSVTSSSESLGNVDCLYVMGMLEGMFPRRRSEDPVLSDDDRIELSSLRPNEPLLLTSCDRSAEERDEFFRLCSVPRSKLAFSYPQTDDERDNVPAFYLAEVERCLESRVKLIHRARSELVPAAPKLEADIRLKAALDGPRIPTASTLLQTEVAKDVIRLKVGEPVSPRTLRDILDCPFRAMASDRLRIRSNLKRNRWYSLRDIPLRAELLKAPDADTARIVLESELKRRLQDLEQSVDSWEMPLIAAGGARLIDEWLDREFLARDVWASDRSSLRTNVEFSDEGPLKSRLPLKGENINLMGTVAAIQDRDGYKVANLYETRERIKSRENEERTDLDRFLVSIYLFALWDERRKVALEVDSIDNSRVLYTLASTEDNFENRQEHNLKVVRMGDVVEVFQAAKANLTKASSRLREPMIDPTPSQSCENCDFGELCRRSSVFGEQRSWEDAEILD